MVAVVGTGKMVAVEVVESRVVLGSSRVVVLVVQRSGMG